MAAQSDRVMSSDDESSFEDIDHYQSSTRIDSSFELIEDAVSPKPEVTSTDASVDQVDEPPRTTPPAKKATKESIVPSEPWHSLKLHPLGIDLSQPLGLVLLYPPRAGDAPPPPIAEIVQHHLHLLFAAEKCRLEGDQYTTGIPHVSTMCEVLQHHQTCTNGVGCSYAHCASSRQILDHWNICQRAYCSICEPFLSDDDVEDDGAVKYTIDVEPYAVTRFSLTVEKYWPFSVLQHLRCDHAYPLGLISTGYPVIKDRKPDTSEVVKHHLYLMLHARKCAEKKLSKPCPLPHCTTMKEALIHLQSCTFGRLCQYAHCASTREIVSHWKHCQRQDCEVCSPMLEEDFSGIYYISYDGPPEGAAAADSIPEHPPALPPRVRLEPTSTEKLSNAAAAMPTAQIMDDPEKRKLIQQQLILLLQADKCSKRVNGANCTLPNCITVKDVIQHMRTCTAGRQCSYNHCTSSWAIIEHWKKCESDDCLICRPIRNIQSSYGSSAVSNSGPSFDFMEPAEVPSPDEPHTVSPVSVTEEAKEQGSKPEELQVDSLAETEEEERGVETDADINENVKSETPAKDLADFETRLKDSETIKTLTAEINRLGEIIEGPKNGNEDKTDEVDTLNKVMCGDVNEAVEQKPDISVDQPVQDETSRKMQDRASFGKYFERLEKSAARLRDLQEYSLIIVFLHVLLALLGSHGLLRIVAVVLSFLGFILNIDLRVRKEERVLAHIGMIVMDLLSLFAKNDLLIQVFVLIKLALAAYSTWSVNKQTNEKNAFIVRLAKRASGLEEAFESHASDIAASDAHPSAADPTPVQEPIRIVEVDTKKIGIILTQLENRPAMIAEIVPNSVAEIRGELRRGDELISIAGINVEGMAVEQVGKLLEDRTGTYKLEVRHNEKNLRLAEKRLSAWE